MIPTSPGRKIRLLFACPGWPSGLLEVASWARAQGLAEAIVVQLRPGQRDEARLLARLVEFRPHLVGFRIEGGRFDDVCRLVAAVRACCDAEIVLGGPTATSHPRDVLAGCGADYVFAGEAEETFAQFLRLAQTYNSRDRAAEIPGLAYSYGGRSFHNTLPHDGYERSALDLGKASRACTQNLVRPIVGDAILNAYRLDWSLLEGFQTEFESLYFTGGRGCPGACSFCAKLHGQDVRIKSASHLLDEIAAADAQVQAGRIRVGRWDLFQHTHDASRKDRPVAWAAVYDEDFFLHRPRAVEFFRLWEQSPLQARYRLSLQTNPCSLLQADGRAHEEIFAWIDRLKPMVQLGAESFHDHLLRRWHKRHRVHQLEIVLDALDRTRQDYTVFQLLTDFDTTAEELVESLRLLGLAAFRHPRMRIAANPYTIPLYDSDARKRLDYAGRLGPDRVRHFTDYERPQPGWMDPLVAELADLADADLDWCLQLEHRDAALVAALQSVAARIGRHFEHTASPRLGELHDQAGRALSAVREASFAARTTQP